MPSYRNTGRPEGGPLSHPALVPGAVAVVTGGASGIGRAAAVRFARMGLRVCIADLGAERLADAARELASVAPDGGVLARQIDVSRREELVRLEQEVHERFGGTDVLMNNAGIGPATGILGPLADWERILAVNLWGLTSSRS